ncbi:MAG: TIGR03560 family F420-dependent LLM class oxidoreductase [Candidatus Bathyarchaeota archaeon]|nr:TIGR03560 family F420-dependent LLM class oxidoreductase [Candidatus Bathyarchaeota archaeon]
MFLPFYALQNGKDKSESLFDRVCSVVLECERLGYDSIWLDDHLMYGQMPLLECWTALSALACRTKRIRLGTMVMSAAFRNPAVLAKMAATLDVISNGRLEVGLGAGVQQEEHEAYGFSFPKPSIRVSRLKESVEILKALWSTNKTSYHGDHYQITGAVCQPKPLQKPHPPIIIGGAGEKQTLKVTAQHADRFDFGYVPTMELYLHKLEVLKSHCNDVGRSYADIEKSCWPAGQFLLAENQKGVDKKAKQYRPQGVSQKDFEGYSFLGTPERCLEPLQSYLDLGVTHFMLFFGDLPCTESLQLLAHAINKI